MHEADPRTPSGSARLDLRPLLALNAVLLIVLAAITFGSSVEAQPRGRGEYTMVAGGVNGSQSSAVYIVDERNQELVVVNFDVNSRTLKGITYRNLAADAAIVTRRGAGN